MRPEGGGALLDSTSSPMLLPHLATAPQQPEATSVSTGTTFLLLHAGPGQ